MRKFFPILLFSVGCLFAPSFLVRTAYPQQATNGPAVLDAWLAELERRVPREPIRFSPEIAPAVAKAADGIEQWAAHLGRFQEARTADDLLAVLRRLLIAKSRVDRLLDATWDVRNQYAALGESAPRREMMRSYLRITSQLIDLSGRMRYLLNDAIEEISFRVAVDPSSRDRLLDLLLSEQSNIGALTMSRHLFDPQAADVPNAAPLAPATVEKAFQLIRVSQQSGSLPLVARFLASGKALPAQVISAAETIRTVGLPQVPRPNPFEELPAPPISGQQLFSYLSRLDASKLTADLSKRRAELLSWLEVRNKQGVTEDSYRIGSFEVQPGDWLLMRNPSPYNLFTDLSPGLFTHVGVVTAEQGADGIRRMVIVDLPERGTYMPAANVEAYILRTLHCVFLRHPDPSAAKDMATAARDVIGNPTEFDLNFRTERVHELKGKPLHGEKINTYCAGLLLLCAQATQVPRDEFFPIPEFGAGGKTIENLAKLGISIGEDFVSPTGAIFSSKLRIVGRREPMYDPQREVEEAIFDHFANCLVDKTLIPSRDLAQSLRLKLAEASKTNRQLAQALAAAAGVSADMDLVAAAKAQAVIETLDKIAYGASGDFVAARDAVLSAAPAELRQARVAAEEISKIERLQQRHLALRDQFWQNLIAPRQVRIELVKYYVQLGKRELEGRFFSGN